MALTDQCRLPKKTSLTIRVRVIEWIGALVVAALVILLSTDIWLPLIGGWLDMPSEIHGAQAIIVNGGNPARTLYAAELYRRGLAPELWHTGYARGRTRITSIVMGK